MGLHEKFRLDGKVQLSQGVDKESAEELLSALRTVAQMW